MAKTSDIVLSASRSPVYYAVCAAVKQIPAIIIASIFAIIDDVPYGFMLFPHQMPEFKPLGAVIVLNATLISQIVFTYFSQFPFAVGLMIAENIPFLQSLSMSIYEDTVLVSRPEKFLSTTLAAFFFSTLMTGIAFYAIGSMNMARLTKFIPRHVLLGCIGGMGVFILFAAISVSSGVPWLWNSESVSAHFTPNILMLWGTSVAIEILLLISNHFISNTLYLPSFFIGLFFVFFSILRLINCPIETARHHGWFLHGNPLSNKNAWFDPWNLFLLSNIQFSNIDWNVLLQANNFYLFCGIAVFSIIHVPLNIPGVSATTGYPVDLNKELKAHGISNIVSAFSGGLQNYVSFSTTLLSYKCGGVTRFTGVGISVLCTIFLCCRPSMTVLYFPTPIAGVMMMHLGVILFWEAFFDYWSEMDWWERICVWVIALSMQYKFIQGIGIGFLCSFAAFVMQCSQIPAIAASLTGSGIRSQALRSYPEDCVLDSHLKDVVHIIKLQGTLFFGNAAHVLIEAETIISSSAHLKVIIIDFSRVVSLDCSAVEKLARVSEITASREVQLVCSGMAPILIKRLKTAKCFAESTSDMDRLPVGGPRHREFNIPLISETSPESRRLTRVILPNKSMNGRMRCDSDIESSASTDIINRFKCVSPNLAKPFLNDVDTSSLDSKSAIDWPHVKPPMYFQNVNSAFSWVEDLIIKIHWEEVHWIKRQNNFRNGRFVRQPKVAAIGHEKRQYLADILWAHLVEVVDFEDDFMKPEDLLTVIVDRLRRETYPQGACICRAGSKVDSMILVEEGVLAIASDMQSKQEPESSASCQYSHVNRWDKRHSDPSPKSRSFAEMVLAGSVLGVVGLFTKEMYQIYDMN
eukprot:GHVL01019611.1.p1 GENE.GHVL01019611.1~~GHVL01019611.1.p1  ORF type:complete len:862 (+),score=99.35 GHVL01019611.1:19-2604(+)